MLNVATMVSCSGVKGYLYFSVITGKENDFLGYGKAILLKTRRGNIKMAKPERRFRCRCCEASVFENEISRDGKTLKVKKVAFQKR